jgi:hypothetical protein
VRQDTSRTNVPCGASSQDLILRISASSRTSAPRGKMGYIPADPDRECLRACTVFGRWKPFAQALMLREDDGSPDRLIPLQEHLVELTDKSLIACRECHAIGDVSMNNSQVKLLCPSCHKTLGSWARASEAASRRSSKTAAQAINKSLDWPTIGWIGRSVTNSEQFRGNENTLGRSIVLSYARSPGRALPPKSPH